MELRTINQADHGHHAGQGNEETGIKISQPDQSLQIGVI